MQNIEESIKVLDSLIAASKTAQNKQENSILQSLLLQSTAINFLVLQISAMIEERTCEIMAWYAKQQSCNRELNNYLRQTVYFHRPNNVEKICEMLDRLNPLWRNKFRSRISEADMQDLKNLNSLRKGIAHSSNPAHGIDYDNVKRYYVSAKTVMRHLQATVSFGCAD